MLKNKIRTKEEIEIYLEELRAWIDDEKNTPAEEMTDFFDNSLNTLLDIGCGTGLELKAIYNRFPDVKITGIDLSRDMLRRLKEKYTSKDIRTIEADYFDYPFENEQYDAPTSN